MSFDEWLSDPNRQTVVLVEAEALADGQTKAVHISTSGFVSPFW